MPACLPAETGRFDPGPGYRSSQDEGFFIDKTTAMTKKFNNKYRIESTRLKGWDYSKGGKYFITILTKNREHF